MTPSMRGGKATPSRSTNAASGTLSGGGRQATHAAVEAAWRDALNAYAAFRSALGLTDWLEGEDVLLDVVGLTDMFRLRRRLEHLKRIDRWHPRSMN